MMQQLAIRFDNACGAAYFFHPEWRRIFARRGISDAPLFCALPAGHANRHVDQATGIPWDASREQ